ncbi:hypothetical protein [Thermovibrio sp.]
MNQITSNNIEALTSKIAFEIVNEGILNENEINKLLGVLTSNGVYAMWVYALDKIGIEFQEDEEVLKKERIFKFLEKIYLLDKFISQRFNLDVLIKETSCLTRNINKLNKELKELRKKHKESQEIERKREQIDQIKEEIQKNQKKRNEKLNVYFIEVSENIHNLLFLKQLLEKTLIYARYHAKALGD